MFVISFSIRSCVG